MPLDFANETLLSLADATKALPLIDGRRPHVSTIWRWCRKGIRGVQLEYLRLGNRVVTTQEALARFAQRLADADGDPPRQSSTVQPRRSRSSRVRQRSIKRAEAELAKAGI